MKFVYPDQNALIDLFDRQQNTDTRFRVPENVQIVLSPVHWIEAARRSEPTEAEKMAHFLDWLNPVWLRERIAVEQSEIEAVWPAMPQISPLFRRSAEVKPRWSLRFFPADNTHGSSV